MIYGFLWWQCVGYRQYYRAEIISYRPQTDCVKIIAYKRDSIDKLSNRETARQTRNVQNIGGVNIYHFNLLRFLQLETHGARLTDKIRYIT